MINSGRNPACNVLPLTGDITSGSLNTNNMENATSNQFTLQHVNSRKGNRCGFNKNNPISFIRLDHKRRPKIIEQSKENLKNLYFKPLSKNAGKMSYNVSKKNKHDEYRQLRAEIRNIIYNCVGEALLHYLDLKTLYVGFMADGKFHFLGINFIYKAIEASLKSRDAEETITYERVRKAIKVFEECGYLYIENEKVMLPDGTYRSKPSKIKFNATFFTDLDVDEHLLSKSLRDQEKRLNREVLDKKAQEYAHEHRIAKKNAKKEMRAINDIIKAAKDGSSLSKDEQEYLDIEYPGVSRKREPEVPLYPEYISLCYRKPPS